jgi:hypothetical protein
MKTGTYDDDAGSCTIGNMHHSKSAQQGGVVNLAVWI